MILCRSQVPCNRVLSGSNPLHAELGPSPRKSKCLGCRCVDIFLQSSGKDVTVPLVHFDNRRDPVALAMRLIPMARTLYYAKLLGDQFVWIGPYSSMYSSRSVSCFGGRGGDSGGSEQESGSLQTCPANIANGEERSKTIPV
jgi:hypothetical protein